MSQTIVDKTFAEKLLKNSLLRFNGMHDVNTGEIYDYREAWYKGWVFKIYPNHRVRIYGSPHILYNAIVNEERHNHNLFGYKELKYVIDYLMRNFEFDPFKIEVHSLEFGLNLALDFPVRYVLDNLLIYKKDNFDNLGVRKKGYGKVCALNEYTVKYYDKGLQHKLRENILRFEIKILKMRKFSENNFYLSDLLNPINWLKCFNYLIEVLHHTIITEPLSAKSLSNFDFEFITKCENTRNWADLTTKARHDRKNRFNKIVKQYGLLNLKQKLILAIERTFELCSPAHIE